MKRIFTMMALFVAFAFAAQAQGDAPAPVSIQPTDGPQMTFESMEIDYGTIEQGSDPYRSFVFTNTGNAPLVITNARGSCGCTVPTWPKEPIPAGETGEIKVRYDTNRVGPFTKRVTLTTNAGEEPIVLTIKGKVEKAPEQPSGLPTNDSGSMFNGGF